MIGTTYSGLFKNVPQEICGHDLWPVLGFDHWTVEGEIRFPIRGGLCGGQWCGSCKAIFGTKGSVWIWIL